MPFLFHAIWQPFVPLVVNAWQAKLDVLIVYQNLGYTLYVRGEVDEALPCFQQCLNVSEGQGKAAGLNMLGCCCAIKVQNGTCECFFNSEPNDSIVFQI